MPKRVVLKIGGGILRSHDCFKRVADIVREKRGKGEEVIIVLSALYGVTDFLIDTSKKCLSKEREVALSIARLREMHKKYLEGIGNSEAKAEFALDEKIPSLEKFLRGINYLGETSQRSSDMIKSFGERISPIILEAHLRDNGINAEFLDAEDAGIYCYGQFGNALADMKKTKESLSKKIKMRLREKVVLLPGYYGIDENNDIKTFGRGGTDYSAGFIASAMNAELEIWKDVSGFMTADPRVVKDAKQIPFLSYDEAEELGYLGAKILNPKTIEPLRKKHLSAEIKNLFNPSAKGTIIGREKNKSDSVAKSITAKKDIAIITIATSSMVAEAGFAARIFSKLAEKEVSVDMIATSETAISFSVEKDELKKSLASLETLRTSFPCKVTHSKGMSLVGIIGEGMKHTPGIAGRLFGVLGRNKINIELISQGASEINISFVVKKSDLEKAILCVHREFFEKGD